LETRVAIVGIIVENMDSVKVLNDILHEYGEYIIGRLGIPYPKKHVNVITVVVDAKQDVINALSGKIGRLDGITVKTISSNTKSLES
jgi:putative iron-only hydrogenase system regulator